MRILLSNDDGYQARGLRVLAEHLADIAELTIVAPARNHSGASNSLTLDTPLRVEQVPIAYDHDGVARDMRSCGLPEEFIDTILTGWWTTCLEILPARERGRGRR